MAGRESPDPELAKSGLAYGYEDEKVRVSKKSTKERSTIFVFVNVSFSAPQALGKAWWHAVWMGQTPSGFRNMVFVMFHATTPEAVDDIELNGCWR